MLDAGFWMLDCKNEFVLIFTGIQYRLVKLEQAVHFAYILLGSCMSVPGLSVNVTNGLSVKW
jgi:hypothetical protein